MNIIIILMKQYLFMVHGSLKIYANACICIYFNEAFHCIAINCIAINCIAMKIFSIKSRKLIPKRDAAKTDQINTWIIF